MSSVCSVESFAVIIVDDCEDHRKLLADAVLDVFGSGGSLPEIFEYEDPDLALADIPPSETCLVFLDNSLRGTLGLSWLDDFVRLQIGPVFLMTASGDETTVAEAFRAGASDYFIKPALFVDRDTMRLRVTEALRKFRLERTNKDLSRKLKVLNRDLENANTRLEELTDDAHNFVDDVAHEFRTPLAVIYEFANLTADGIGGPVSGKQAEFLSFIQDATRDLTGLIDDFLDTSKLKARSIYIARDRVNPCEIINGVLPMLQARAHAREITLVVEAPEDLPEIYFDVDKARRTLINLVVNAIKFSPQGGCITITCESAESMIRFSILDEGPGLTEEAAESIFSRFQQVDGGHTSDCKGFGLGLNIVKQLTQINFGRIGLISEIGQGSTFSFELPLASPDELSSAVLALHRKLTPRGALSVLRCVATDVSEHGVIRENLCGWCRPFDLVYPQDDGSILIIGETATPQRWAERLSGCQRERDFRIGSPRAGAIFETIETFPVRLADGSQLSQFLNGYAREDHG